MVTYGFPAFAAGVNVVSCGAHFLRGCICCGGYSPDDALAGDILARQKTSLTQSLEGTLDGPLAEAALGQQV